MYLYLYRMVLDSTGEYYIGRRKSNLMPELDPYRGSMSKWKIDKSLLRKEIIRQDFLSFEELCEAESIMIRDNIKNPLCKNAHIPDKGFYSIGPQSESHKTKLSGKQKGIPKSEETKRKMRESKKNISEETRKKMSESRKGVPKTEETKKKISESKRHISEETRKKMSDAWNRRRAIGVSEETRKKMSESHKKPSNS